VDFPTDVLQRLQHLTCLELAQLQLQQPAAVPGQKPLRGVTRLVDLMLDRVRTDNPQATMRMLSGT
jgi:hypothetical protein